MCRHRVYVTIEGQARPVDEKASWAEVLETLKFELLSAISADTNVVFEIQEKVGKRYRSVRTVTIESEESIRTRKASGRRKGHNA